MSATLKINLVNPLECTDEASGIKARDFGVSGNSIHEGVTDTDSSAYKQELNYVKILVTEEIYKCAGRLATSAKDVQGVDKITYVGDLTIEDYGMFVTVIDPDLKFTKTETELVIDINILVEVKDSRFYDQFDIAEQLVEIFKDDLSKRLNTELSQGYVTARYI